MTNQPTESANDELEIEELEDGLEEVSGGACHCAGACSSGDCSGCCNEQQV